MITGDASGRFILSNGGGGIIDTNGFSTAIDRVLIDSNPVTFIGSLTKTGAGTLTLSNTNTYTGTTTVTGGTLLVNGSIATSTTTVSSSGTLGGTGTTGSDDRPRAARSLPVMEIPARSPRDRSRSQVAVSATSGSAPPATG